jgi:hypothetical protein
VRRVAVTGLVLALIGGTAAAFTITEALKLEPSPVGSRRVEEVFSPTCGCPTRVARFSLRLRRADRLDLDILSGGEPVRSLARDLEVNKRHVRVRWDGRDDAGEIVPDGVYHLRVQLQDAGRTVDIPRRIRVDTEGPELEILGVDRPVFSPDDDGRRDSIRIGYRTNDEAAPVVFVNGRVAAEASFKEPGEADVAWDGRVDGRPLRAGEYALFVRVRDAAGNLSPAGKVTVEVRYIELAQSALVVRRGGELRFHVVADAAGFSWTLRRSKGSVVRADAREKPGVVTTQLPDRIRPGRYVLEVAANGHRDRAAVRVLSRRR